MKNWKEKIKNEPIIFMLRKMWRFSRDNKKNIILYATLIVIANIVALAPPIVFGKFINEIQKNNITDSNIYYLIILLLSLLLIHIAYWSFHGPARIIERKNSFLVRKNYQLFLEKNILEKNLDWHNNRDSGSTIDKINNSSSSLFEFSDSSFIAIENFVRVFGTLIAISFFNIYISAGILIFLIVPFVVMNKFDKKLVKQHDKLNIFKNKVSAKVFDTFSNITSVVILNIRNVLLKDIEKAIEKPKTIFIENSKLNEKKWFSIGFIVEIFITIPLILYVLYYYKNNTLIEIGTLTTLYMYLRNITGVFFNVGWYYQGVIEQKADVANISEIENSFSKNKKTQKTKIQNWNKLQIKNLNFRYLESEDKNNHLDNIDLEIQKGEKIAFIGKSGSGKTTFLKVLHGLYDNAESEISFKDRDFQKTNLADLNLKTMLVPQEPELFSSSIRENVTFGLDYSDEEIKKVLDLASFSDVLEQLPKGLDSVVNEKGVNLSGGQKQKLALARALLFSDEKEIILLDESTSSVDPNSEVEIYKNIFKEFSGKTFLASIHKMNLLKYFDRIVIFENGKIVGEGTFEELYNRDENFKKQWDEYVKEK